MKGAMMKIIGWRPPHGRLVAVGAMIMGVAVFAVCRWHLGHTSVQVDGLKARWDFWPLDLGVTCVTLAAFASAIDSALSLDHPPRPALVVHAALIAGSVVAAMSALSVGWFNGVITFAVVTTVVAALAWVFTSAVFRTQR
jgi:hypothetical protein